LYLKDEIAFMNKSYLVNQNQSRSDFYDYINESYNYRIFEFDGNECGVEFLEYYNSEGIILERIHYTYNSENCSYEATFEYSDFSNGHRIYDDKNGHDASTVSEIIRRGEHHNTIENRLWSTNNDVSPNYSYNSVYEYNEEDYPVMETRTYLNESVFVYTYEYY
ncbi:MAG: hypothetical protein KUG68_12125, partial [Flavobacteriaceae bacterium]|nr:hypothetical protein [Flavobacteriaceae bacterium]